MKTIKLNGAELKLTPEQEKDLLAQLTKKQGRWKPEIGENYWRINIWGDVTRRTFGSDSGFDIFNLSIGNIYQTKEEAEQALKTGWVARLQAEQRIKDYILEKGYDTDVDWEQIETEKYYVMRFSNKKLKVDYSWTNKYSTLLYFKHKNEAEDTLEHCKEDYKLLLGVE